jgi:hypothetical protein
MYSSIDNLVYQCGQSFIVDLLPSLFTKIDTTSAEEKEAIMDFDYNGSLISTYNDISNYAEQNLKDTNIKIIFDTMYDLTTVINLCNECKSKSTIDIETVDYIVISNLGHFNVRCKNVNSVNNQFKKSLYLDMQSVRIALIDEQTRRTWERYSKMFRNGAKIFCGYFIFRYFLNLTNFTSVKRLITM